MPRHRHIPGRVRAGGDDAAPLTRCRALDHRERAGVARELEAAIDAPRGARRASPSEARADTADRFCRLGTLRLRALPEGATWALPGDGGPHQRSVDAGSMERPAAVRR